jgi:predicted flap endonuclease-1-like 5' DNA nuclease
MFTWMTEYWYLCLIALLIGIATGWWIWARYALDADANLSAPAVAAPVVPPAPLVPAKPDIPAAEPVKFAEAPAPAVAAAPAAAAPKIAAAVGDPDDLELIKGVGPKLNALLISLGVRRFDQIAAWGASEIAEVDQYLGAFKGRIDRDNWIDQAGLLARGDKAAFEAKYGALGSEIK